MWFLYFSGVWYWMMADCTDLSVASVLYSPAPERCKIPWQCKQSIFKADECWSTVQLFEIQIFDFFFFFSLTAQMVGWAAVPFDMLSSTPGKVLCLHGWWFSPLTIHVLFQHVPAAGCLLVLVAPVPESWPDPHQDTVPCGLEKLLTKLPMVWLLFSVQLLVCDSSGAWSKAEPGFWVVPWDWNSEVPVLHLPTACPPLPSPNTAASRQDVPSSDSTQMVFREQKRLKCVCHGVNSTGKS